VPIFDLLAHLYGLPNVVYACVGAEKHENGDPHRHAFVQFDKPLRTRNEKYFDYGNYHPNVQGCRSPKASLRYVQKEGDFLEEGCYVEANSGPDKKEAVPAADIKKAATEMTIGDFLCWCSENRVMYGRDIWQAYARTDTTTILDGDNFNPRYLDPAFLKMMQEKLREGLIQEKAVVLVGASGIGKTVIAKRLIRKPALFVSHIDQLKSFRPGYHKGIVFDDVGFKHTPITNQIAICDYDNPRAIHCRHTVANIPARVMKIFTCNDAPLELEHEAIARRIQLIQCNHGHLNKYREPLSKKIN